MVVRSMDATYRLIDELTPVRRSRRVSLVTNAASGNRFDVRDLRKRLGWTQRRFAEQLHVTPLTVLRWEAGQSAPRPLALSKLRELEQELAAAEAGRAPTPSVRAPATHMPVLDFAGNPDAVLAVAEAHRLAFGHQFNPAFASEISRIDPLPHQRIAVYEHMLRQDPLRFLLADDAGAGKTIMTGLMVREMLSRGRIRRVLVVPPAGLVGNWERELRTLFRLDFRIVAGEDARAGNPFQGEGSDLAIVSLDTLARGAAFDRLSSAETAPYDLVVFDEAHKLAAETVRGHVNKTQRYELAEALAGCAAPASEYGGLPWRARHLLLLTATPHMGKDSPYHHLWRLLDPHVFATGEACRRFPPAARARHFIRRTKEEMVDLQGRALYRERKCDTFGYDLSASEQALYDATTDYLTSTFRQALGNPGAARLALGVFQRRLASSAWALLRSFERRIEKLARHAADLQAGKATLDDLAGGSRRFERRGDYFDEHGADDDYREGMVGEAHEDFEAEVLGAVVAATVEDLQAEVGTLTGLRGMAQKVLDDGNEAKFVKLREVLEDGAQGATQEKWLVFTEHRDTLEYLVRRLDGLGYVGQVAQIHGGMDWREREAQVEQFRHPDGARFCIATDAAGEGINLQFCARMANYDIPWNPARLEQRMGRIHRYGQTRDVTIVNLVAASTREGRVLARLLEKLDAIRAALRSDKVFDVIGRLFENVSLKDAMLGAATDDGEQGAIVALDEALTAERVAALRAAERRIYGAKGDVAGRLGQLQGDIERERYLQLTPGYVRQFVATATALLGLEIRGDLDGVFALAPREAGALDALLPALAAYDAEARHKLRVYRPNQGDAPCVWLHPGEPVFDALAARVIERFGADALRGSIFIDPRASEPYLCHLAIASLRLEESAASASTLLERRLIAVRHNAEGEPALCAVEPLLLLHSAPHVPPGAVPLAARAVGMKADAVRLLAQVAHEELAEERRTALRAELPERQRQAAAGFDLRAAELAAERQALGKEAEAEGLATIKKAQRDLLAERADALQALASEPDRVVAGEVQFVAHALAIPPPEGDETERYDERVEDIAVRIAIAWERERGATVQDVSKPELARNAGLPNWPGFDLLATQPGGRKRRIEVKGRAGRDGIHMEANEWKQACHLESDYWLYVVFDCATAKPELLRVQNPFHKLVVSRQESAVFAIAASAVAEAAEGD